MKKPINKVVILGGGTAGWLSAALLKKVLGVAVDIELVESDAIGSVGVGEATIPPIRLVNNVLGLDEAEFVRETQATIKLAIRFENWRVKGEQYYHSFGSPGKSMAFCHFHHLWLKAKTLGRTESLWDYDLNYLCCEAGKFSQINAKDPALSLPFAYHFDAALYAKFLNQFSQKLGVTRTEGKVDRVIVDPVSGDVQHLVLDSGQMIDGDLFIDCSGFSALLIEKTLGTGFDDWSHLLPCDKAIAVPSEPHKHTAPFTRSIAHESGWQWRIPLQHRNGNGHVYCSRYMSDDEASAILLNHLDTPATDDPRVISFTTGRRRKQWNKNVVAIGLSSGFVEPLESTSIHLIQSGIVRLLQLFPHQGIDKVVQAEYNAQSEREFTQIRDFIVMHYYLNERNDSAFWRDRRQVDLPETLKHKMALFAANGKLFRDQNDLFMEGSWLQVMIGQGILPQDYHPVVNNMSDQQLLTTLDSIKALKNEPLSSLPSHDDYLASLVRSSAVTL